MIRSSSSRWLAAARAAALIALALAPAALGCGGGAESTSPIDDDAGRPRRVIQPPAGVVRSLPPYAIRADGVGPYRLGAPLGTILASLQSGPRLAMLDIPGVAEYSVVRAEDGAVHVGGESMGAARYVAVLGPDIARTESGVAVGSSRADVDKAMGEPLAGRTWARDSRFAAYAGLANARFVIENGRVAGVLLVATSDAAPGPAAPPPAAPVARDAGVSKVIDRPAPAAAACDLSKPRDPVAILEAASDGRPAGGRPSDRLVPACFGGVGDALVVGRSQVVVVVGDGERVRRLIAIEAPGLTFAAPVVGDGDRDEIAMVAERNDDRGRTITVTVIRLEGARAVRLIDEEVYAVRSDRSWGAGELAEPDLLIELHVGVDDVVVGGVVVRHADAAVVDLAPLTPVVLTRKRRPTVPEVGVDAGAAAEAGGRADAGSGGAGGDSGHSADAANQPP